MLLATTQVEDVDRFIEVFSTSAAEVRKKHGSKGVVVFRDPSERDRVWGGLRLGRAGLAELRVRP
jgi:quinol monooxygenase YgiN